MDRAGDMERPVGFWVKQVLANGEEIEVMVLHATEGGQGTVGTTVIAPNVENARTNARSSKKS